MNKKISLTYKEAKSLASTLGYKTKADYVKGTLPDGLVKNPLVKYKDKFEGWTIYLGKEDKASKKNIEKITRILIEGCVYSLAEWKEAIKIGLLNKKDFPVGLTKVMPKEQLSKIFFDNKHRLPLPKFIEIMAKEKIHTLGEYKNYIDTAGRTNLPTNPCYYYRKQWSDIKKEIILCQSNSKSCHL